MSWFYVAKIKFSAGKKLTRIGLCKFYIKTNKKNKKNEKFKRFI